MSSLASSSDKPTKTSSVPTCLRQNTQKYEPLRLLVGGLPVVGAQMTCLTFRSGMLNLLLTDRLLVRVVATISLSQVCWHVFSPGAEINQNSVMAAGQEVCLPSLWWEEVTEGEVGERMLAELYCDLNDFFLFFGGIPEDNKTFSAIRNLAV